MVSEPKASRILDAAETLLVDFGYRKVTVDEVARRAGVGKGTVYLYWPSKVELFGGVLARDAARLITEEIKVLRADPAEVRLHRAYRRLFLQVMRKPLARALYTRDHDMLGEVMTTSRGWAQRAADRVETKERYLGVLYKHGLLADDPAADPALAYRHSATVTGFFLVDDASPSDEAGLAAKADALAITLHRAFEPATEPTSTMLRAAAEEVVGLYEQWMADYTASLPGEAV